MNQQICSLLNTPTDLTNQHKQELKKFAIQNINQKIKPQDADFILVRTSLHQSYIQQSKHPLEHISFI